MSICTLQDIQKAQENFPPWIRHTRLLKIENFPGAVPLWVKTENLQYTGSFKVRGAYNRMRTLTEQERKRGVIASSAGNHAQGVALAAREMGIQATIVMPKFAPMSKINATRSLGADVILYGELYDDTYTHAKRLEESTGATFIHPYDDPMVIAGQGTVALEIMEDYPDANTILVPIGGGGLAAGIAVAAKALAPSIKIYGVEPAGAASMKAAFEQNGPAPIPVVKSFADGVAVKTVGKLSYEICRQYLDGIMTVDDDDTAAAILWMMENHKMMMEGAGALSIAAFMSRRQIGCFGKNTVAIASGGNIDVKMVSRIIERGLIKTGRRATLMTTVNDRPGELSKLTQAVSEKGANILSINHDRNRSQVELGECQVELVLETNNRQHIEQVTEYLTDLGYMITELD